MAVAPRCRSRIHRRTEAGNRLSCTGFRCKRCGPGLSGASSTECCGRWTVTRNSWTTAARRLLDVWRRLPFRQSRAKGEPVDGGDVLGEVAESEGSCFGARSSRFLERYRSDTPVGEYTAADSIARVGYRSHACFVRRCGGLGSGRAVPVDAPRPRDSVYSISCSRRLRSMSSTEASVPVRPSCSRRSPNGATPT